jgi:drug/metabolite transporter (DMT)-like permease
MGILLSFVTAFIDAFNNTFIKKGAASFSLLTVTWAWQLFSLLVLIPALFIVGIPEIQMTFWWPALLKVVLQVAAIFLYTAALRKTDISLAVPMLAFTPLVTMIVSFFLSGDTPSTMGMVGVILIILGVYLLNIKEARKNLVAPFKAVFDNKGVFYMFLVSLLWGVTTSLDKVAVLSSAPIFYSAFVAMAISLILTPIAIYKYKKEFFKVFKPVNLKKLVPIGALDGIQQMTLMTAVGLTLAGYAIAIKRSSIIISSILGYAMFKEDIKKRILPILVTFSGILLIVLFK